MIIQCNTCLIINRQLLTGRNRTRRKDANAALAADRPILNAAIRFAAVIQKARARAVRGRVDDELIRERHVVQVPVAALSENRWVRNRQQ
jgi:hypothetical protein